MKRLPLFGAALLCAGSALAQAPANPLIDTLRDALKKGNQQALDSFQNHRVDMAVPASPAFAVLGTTPSTILQPHSPRDLAASLVQALTDREQLGNGVGFDIAPYLLFAGKSLTLDEYRRSEVKQRLVNLQMSFGVIRSDDGAEKVSKAAVGFSLPLLDEADPRARDSGLEPCLRKVFDESGPTAEELQAAFNAQRGLAGPASDAAAKAALRPAAERVSAGWDACRETFRQRAWSGTRWLAGLARAYDNRDAGLKGRTANFWTTYTRDMTARPADAAADTATTRSQLQIHLRRTVDEECASDSDVRGFVRRSGTLLAGGYRYGSEKRNLTLEISADRGRYDNGLRETSRKLALGGELKVTQDFWLVVTVGGEGGRKSGKNSPFALAAIKFGAASESTGAFGP
jgi:hypothetical protein